MKVHNLIVITARRNHCDEFISLSEQVHRSCYFFTVKTCLRTVWMAENDTQHSGLQELVLACRTSGFDVFTGSSAYEFILSFGCGLESFIPGENEVFGQLKKAWSTYHEGVVTQLNFDTPRFLHPVVQKIFADIRDIRRDFLQGIGSSSYASISRKLLAPKEGDRVLIVGTGKLAQSAAPLLQRYNLAVWARDKEKLVEFQDQFQSKYNKSFVAVTCEELVEVASQATHILLCIPKVEEVERKLALANPRVKVVHLGAEKSECFDIWTPRAEGAFFGLDDVFLEEKLQLSQKAGMIYTAREACRKKAEFRAARSATIDSNLRIQVKETTDFEQYALQGQRYR